MQKADIVAYVVDQYGCPLMPMRSHGRVSRLLKSGRAHIKSTLPFIIQLNYEPESRMTEKIYLGEDPGRTNFGLCAILASGEVLYAAEIETVNKYIAALMRARKMHRMASRRGQRKAKQRRARRNGTQMGLDEFEIGYRHGHPVFSETGMGRRPRLVPVWERFLPHYKKPVRLKGIKNKQSRYCNRKRPHGWLTPTVNQLLQSLENSINLVLKLLPVTDITLELNSFAFARMEDPQAHGQDFCNGPLKGFLSVAEAVAHQQGGHCLLCGAPIIEETHHIKPVSRGGNHNVANCVGLCEKHHNLVHTDDEWFDRMLKRKAGLEKKYAALSALNQVIPFFWAWLQKFEPFIHVHATTGWQTKKLREKLSLPKEHHVDAWCIAVSALEKEPASAPEPWAPYHIMQFRRHDRARVKRTESRTYFLEGKKVATNRRKAIMAVPKQKKDGTFTIKEKSQAADSLEEFRNRMVKIHGEAEARRIISRLTVKKSRHVYNNMDRYLPGMVFTTGSKRKGTKERHVLRGNHNGGTRYIIAQYGVEALKADIRMARRKASAAKKASDFEAEAKFNNLIEDLKAQLPKDKEYQDTLCRFLCRNTGLVYVTETY